MDGTVTLGAFDLVAPLGRGGIAEVWRGVHRAQGVPVAIKVVPDASHRRGVGLTALREEVRAVAELNHPNVIWVYDQGEVDEAAGEASSGLLLPGSHWFAMELAEGGALDRNPESWEALRAVLVPLLQALAYAHAHGVVHRDVKPANILFGGARPGLKLCDFGLMVALGSPVQEGARGTPAYMAPEQCLGLVRDQGPWTDLYAVGCVAFTLACGRNPYVGSGWAAVFSGHAHSEIPELQPRFAVPQGFASWVNRLLQKRPADRLRWAADALRALEQLGGVPAAEVVPLRWEHPTAPRFSAGLEGAGIGLFGLRQIPVVGRVAERDRLWEGLRAIAADGAPRAIVLRGPTGTGKTRLAEWLCHRAHEVGAASVIRTRHSPEEGPDQGLAGLVLAATRCEHLDRAGVEERLEALLRAEGVEDSDEWRRLAQLVRPVDADAERQPLGQRERHGLVRRALERSCSDRPVLILLDDVQWGLDALRFVHDLSTEAGGPPLLFVLTYQEDDGERDLEEALVDAIAALPLARTVQTGLLGHESQKALIRSLLVLEPELEAQVCELTGGHPGFAVQLIGDWVERGLLASSGHGYALRSERSVMPASQLELARSRLDAVIGERGDSWRFPLELAATLGLVVDGQEWAGVCAIRRVDPDPVVVESLRAVGLARSVPGSVGSFAFEHGLLREALLGEAFAQGRIESHHRACARMLDTAVGPGTQARRGVHHLAGGDLVKAVGPLLVGANEHFLAGEYGMAARLLGQREQALTLVAPGAADPQWGEGWMLWTRLRRSQGRFEEAQNWLVKVLGAARLHCWTALEIAARIQAAKSESSTEARAPHVQRAFELAQELGDPEHLAEARYQLAIEAANRGENQRAAEEMLSVIAAFQAQGRRVRLQGAWIDLAHVWMQDERYEDVARALSQADAESEATASRYVRALIAMLRGEVARQRGQLDQAEGHYLEAWRLNDAIGNVAALLARIHVGLTRAEKGQFAEAAPDLEVCLRMSERSFYQLAAHLGLLLCRAAEPSDPAWNTHLQAVVAWADGGRADADVARVLRLAAQLASRAGHPDRARGAWEASARQLDSLGRTADAQAARARAQSAGSVDPNG